ncbi:uncharacterized protein LOC120497552 [Passer montanus]|uniref:uncharacterized protein LOC120497552 n=1 Tax=Passer montanus TaxID=9160 RepID=UPI00196168CC|nr:uncharacterized protein LOC120497552 [Passer montanus]
MNIANGNQSTEILPISARIQTPPILDLRGVIKRGVFSWAGLFLFRGRWDRFAGERTQCVHNTLVSLSCCEGAQAYLGPSVPYSLFLNKREPFSFFLKIWPRSFITSSGASSRIGHAPETVWGRPGPGRLVQPPFWLPDFGLHWTAEGNTPIPEAGRNKTAQKVADPTIHEKDRAFSLAPSNLALKRQKKQVDTKGKVNSCNSNW